MGEAWNIATVRAACGGAGRGGNPDVGSPSELRVSFADAEPRTAEALRRQHPRRDRNAGRRRHERPRRTTRRSGGRHARPHESATLHVTGRAMYTDDLAALTAGRVDRMAGAVDNAHAKVTIDVSRRLRVPGVVRVLTADDVPGVNDAGVKSDEPLFPNEAMYYGHALVWVLGETPEAARLGAAAVTVDYEPPRQRDHRDRGHRRRVVPGRCRAPSCRGDAAAALAAAPLRVRGRDRVRRSGALLPRDPGVARARSTPRASTSWSPPRSTRARPRRSSRT